MSDADDDDDTTWRRDVEAERQWREDLYLGDETPLSAEARARFKKLAWFPLDARYRLRDVRLARHAQAKPAALAATGDEGVDLLEVGTFTFDLDGTPCTLTAFEPAPGESDEPYLLIPFRDATSARKTYGAGRYLDLEPDEADVYELDFNRAYHPYCAHDDAWSCTLPPPQNTLAVRIEAGERL